MNRSQWPVLWIAVCAMPGLAQACACGCGVFDVATSAMFPTHSGAFVFLEQDFMDQNTNWSGTSSAPAANNPDKDIRTHFWTVGVQYMFNRSWTAEVDIPYWQRHFVTEGAGTLATFDHDALGDVRLKATWTGLSPDLSTGFMLGLKLPTGDSTYPYFDPDVQIGTGSTDLLLGAFHRAGLSADSRWSWFASAEWQQPVLHKEGYRPGAEGDAVAGIYYAGWNFGTHVHLAPVLQAHYSYRGHDGGPAGDAVNTGYQRAFLTPGLELDTGNVRIYADVSQALYTNVSGNQLVARTLYKISVGVAF